MINNIKQLLENIIDKIYSDIIDGHQVNFTVERPNNDKHGDLSTNIALKLASVLKENPILIAETIVKEIKDKNEIIEKIEIVKPGFINFFIKDNYFQNIVEDVLSENRNYKKSNFGKNKKVQVEFVSANPTGPLTIGHGRQAVLGDTISRILEWNGYEVTREYYFNDAGRQMRLLGESVYARYMELLGEKLKLPQDGYEGEYIKDIARLFLEKYGEKYSNNQSEKIFIDFSTEYMLKSIKNTLKKLNIIHDVFFNEKTLYENGKIDEVLKKMEQKGSTYKSDGAIWFKATEFGAEKDRVLVKNSGEPTYRLPDIAYHAQKLEQNYDQIIDIFGADHHATYPDVVSALKVMGYDTSKIKVLLHQFVTLVRKNEKIKMSTRKGNFITLDELIDIAGSDVVRYFFIMRNMDSHLNFDIELAQKETDENPVYYLQYAHARISNVIKHSKLKGIRSFEDGNIELLKEKEEIDILKVISEFEETMELCRTTLEPMYLANYLHKLATYFHKFYQKHRVVTENKELTKSRLKLIKSIKIIFSNCLYILGIEAPDNM
ncbi:MAG: arginine--tRNA ligase [Candidatus Marinimicrobia bacterium]|nr:arginine--tRNA ligase [Candidatus Neomarinimicrobiota bacterium]